MTYHADDATDVYVSLEDSVFAQSLADIVKKCDDDNEIELYRCRLIDLSIHNFKKYHEDDFGIMSPRWVFLSPMISLTELRQYPTEHEAPNVALFLEDRLDLAQTECRIIKNTATRYLSVIDNGSTLRLPYRNYSRIARHADYSSGLYAMRRALT